MGNQSEDVARLRDLLAAVNREGIMGFASLAVAAKRVVVVMKDFGDRMKLVSKVFDKKLDKKTGSG